RPQGHEPVPLWQAVADGPVDHGERLAAGAELPRIRLEDAILVDDRRRQCRAHAGGMEERGAERETVRVDMRYAECEVAIALEAIEEVLRAEREPWVRRPEQIRAGFLLLPGRLASLDGSRRIREEERHTEIARRPLESAEQARRELLI